MQKYVVDVCGVRMGLPDFSNLVGVSYDTVLYRAQKGKKLLLPQEACARAIYLEGAESKPGGESGRIGAFADAYTFEELAELYKSFAGQPDEVRIIMDFTGVQRRTAEKLLSRLRENAELKRRGIA